MKPLLITIDGPAGAGKTTVSRLLAKRLGYKYVDTGALYRAIAYQAKINGVPPNDDFVLEQMCQNMTIEYIHTSDLIQLKVNGVDITDLIRTPEISMLASAVSAMPSVRSYLLDLQRRLGAEKRAVFEGRDMGTVVFPDADIKFFLNASLSERARRRFLELSPNSSITLDQVEADIRRRDQQDSTRHLAPLKPAPDAICIDSTSMKVENVVDQMLSIIEKIRQ